MNYLALYEPIKETAYKFSSAILQDKNIYGNLYFWLGVVSTIVGVIGLTYFAHYAWKKRKMVK